MFARVYNRIVGWLFVALGIVGLTVSHIGEYMFFTRTEALSCLAIGIVSTTMARQRHRYSAAGALLLGVVLFVFGFAGLTMPTTFGGVEPLECVLRLVAGAWGIYVSIHDVLLWRSVQLPS